MNKDKIREYVDCFISISMDMGKSDNLSWQLELLQMSINKMKEDIRDNSNGLSKVIELYKSVRTLESNKEDINSKIDSTKILIAREFIPILKECYDNWNPTMGEKMMLVDFIDNIAFPVTLSYINGNDYKAAESAHCNHRFSTDLNIDEYETASFVIPMELFNKIKSNFNFDLM